MSAERRQQIEELYHAALQHDPGQRSAFLKQACKEDQELRREVESLLVNDSTVTQVAVGAQLGPYRIEARLGAGGMGEVYKALDTRLGRGVAIKIVHEQFSARFEREARAISALNHPHICTLYDVGPNYLVMELVEGETLAERLRKGKRTTDEVLGYGSQIADALAAAHCRGIIHRDLKPGNIMVTKAGVKVLDFGLAKSPQDESLTASRVVMGTPAYMAPEQRDGSECDARTDIYALGLVLHEMATGKRAARDQSAPMEGVPEKLAHVIERCVAQDPADRWQAASDVKRELKWAGKVQASTPVKRWSSRWIWGIAVGLLAILLAIGWMATRFRPHVTAERSLRLALNIPPGADLGERSAISPDGRLLVIVARSAGIDKLWIRPLNASASRELPGTDGALAPFWSPDSRSVGFFASGKLKRAEVAGGTPTVICNVGLGRGGTWNSEGTILFNSVNDGPLLRVPAVGADPTPITTVDTAKQENSHRWPYFLPGGRRFLYFIRSGSASEGVYLGSLDQPREKIKLLSSKSNAVYAPARDGQSGFLLWVRDGTLMAQPFDAEGARLIGEAVALAEMVRFNSPARSADVSVSNDGALVYAGSVLKQYQLTWYSRDGIPLGTVGPPDSYGGVRLSPDGTRIAVMRSGSPVKPAGIALLELRRGIPTSFADAAGTAWSPDSQRIAYGWSHSGPPNLYTKEISGAGPPQRLTDAHGSQFVYDWSADGRFLLYGEASNDLSAARTQLDLWVLPLTGDRKPIPFAQNHFQEMRGQFSPDVKWIGYTSNESGRNEIYAQSFPAGRAKWQISSNGGDYVRWRKDGRELFYLAPDGTLMSVAVRPLAGSLEFGSPSALFKVTLVPTPFGEYIYDFRADGQRILAFAPVGEAGTQSLNVVLNWQAELGRAGK